MIFDTSEKNREQGPSNRTLTTPDANLGKQEINSITHEDDEEICGIELHEYAKKHSITTDVVWKKIRKGELVARTENGFVYVYGTQMPPSINTMSFPFNSMIPSDSFSLPPIPTALTEQSQENVLVPKEQASSPLALLFFESLKTAKEEQREIIRLTQESIKQISDMTEKVLEMKDGILKEKEELLKSKTEEVNFLKEKLADKEKHCLSLLQQKEDLEMLARSLTDL